MAKKLETLSIIYPAFNEEAYVERAVEAACEVGNAMVKGKQLSSYEVIIINDASTDGTRAITEGLNKEFPHVKCVNHDTNKGLGGAVKSGFSHAAGDIILYSDIDLPFDMMELKKAYRLMRYYEADIVTAFRFDRTCEGLRRHIYSKVYNGLIQLIFGLRIKDVNFSCKLIRRRVLDHIALKSQGSFIDAELLVKADRYQFHTIQFGTNYFHRSRGVSTLSSMSVIIKILKEMASLYKEIQSIKPVKSDDEISHR